MRIARTVLSVAAVGAVLAAGEAPAQYPPPAPQGTGIGGGGPAADYTAEFKIQNFGPKVRGRVYGAPGKERRETADPWGGSTMIFRYDLGVAWLILPGAPRYTEFPLRPPGSPALPPGAVPPGLARIEDDDINDIPATKYAFPPTPAGPGGHVWLSREGIALRIDGQPRPGFPEIRFELDNLTYAPQNPNLFELPAGYQRIEPPMPPTAAAPQGMPPQGMPPQGQPPQYAPPPVPQGAPPQYAPPQAPQGPVRVP